VSPDDGGTRPLGLEVVMPAIRAVTIVSLVLLGAPLLADAQQTPRVYRVGVLASGGVDETFLQALRALGYVDELEQVVFHRGLRRIRVRSAEYASGLLGAAPERTHDRGS